MAAYHNDLSQFRQLRDQAARKKQLEARRAGLLPQCQDLAAQAEARKTERLEAEQELAGLESKGPLGLLYTIAGGKAQRLKEAQKTLRTAKEAEQQAVFAMAEAQASLAQTERELEGLTGLEDAFAAARQASQASQDTVRSITRIVRDSGNTTRKTLTVIRITASEVSTGKATWNTSMGSTPWNNR